MLFPGAPCRASQTVEARARAVDAMADTAIVARLDAPVASSPRAAPSREHERNADALFESRSVVEVREVVMRTEREARDKEEELRQLVGSSYRDAIASADTFAEMESNAKRVVSLLTDTRDTLRRLPRIVAEAEALAAGKEIPPQKMDGKLTGFTHARLRQQMEVTGCTGPQSPERSLLQTRMSGAGAPVPFCSQPAGFAEAVTRHFNVMEGAS